MTISGSASARAAYEGSLPTAAISGGVNERRSRPSSARIPSVDGLRAFAVAGVICFHFGIGPSGGFLGVDLFFVISGFVIARALLAEHERSGRIDLSSFWKRRFRRIFPTLALILFAVAVWSWTMDASASFRHAVSTGTLAALVSAGNWWQIVGTDGYWSLDSARDPLTHLWSLGVEEQFYLVFPLLFILLLRFVPHRFRWLVSTLATTAFYAWTAAYSLLAELTANGSALDRLYLGTDTRSGALLAGGTIALLVARGQPQRRSQAGIHIARAGAWLACPILIVLWLRSSSHDTMFFAVELPLSGVAAAVLIWSVVAAPGSPVARIL